MHRLRPGAGTLPRREVGSSVYQVFDGGGSVHVGERSWTVERGDMFVDLSPQVTTNHSGGALDELFTVYAVVNALTVNLPAIQRVQLLIDGKETDTLAGHVDLRNPLSRNMNWVKTENP